MNIRLLIVTTLLMAHQIACSSKKSQPCSSSSSSSSLGTNSFASLSTEDEESGTSDQDEPDMTEESEENESLQELLIKELAEWEKLKEELKKSEDTEFNSKVKNSIDKVTKQYNSLLTSRLDGNKDVSTTESTSKSLVLDSSKKKKKKNKGKGNSPKTTTTAPDHQKKEKVSISQHKTLTGIDCIVQMVFEYGLVAGLEKHEEDVRSNELIAEQEKEKHTAYHIILNTCQKLASERQIFLDNHLTVKKKCNKNELKMLEYFRLKNLQDEQEFCLPCHKAIDQVQGKISKKFKEEYLARTNTTKTLTTESPEFLHFVNFKNPQGMTVEQLESTNTRIIDTIEKKSRELIAKTQQSIKNGKGPLPITQYGLTLS